MDLTL
jgi:isovaleryl-CoA dehydrogenase